MYGPCLFCYLRLGHYLWLVWFVAQHCHVTDMCLIALALHRRMLGIAHRGHGSNRYLVTSLANRLCALFSLLSLVWILRLCWQGLWSTNAFFRTLRMRHCLLSDPSQYVLVSRLLVGLVDNTPPGGWLLTCMMRCPSSSNAVWFAVFVFWGLPLFWLSLLLERLADPKQEPLWSRFCWQQPVFLAERDEVKGKSLFVNEELFSETSLATYFDLSKGECRVAWCFGAGLRPCYCTYVYPFACLLGVWFYCWNIFWVRSSRVLCAISCLRLWQRRYLAGPPSVQASPEQFTWNSRCWVGPKGTLRSQFLFSWQTRGAASRLDAYIRSFCAPVSKIDQFECSLSSLVVLYYSFNVLMHLYCLMAPPVMVVVIQAQCITGLDVNRLYAFCIQSDVNCITSTTRNLDQQKISNSTFVCLGRALWHLICILGCMGKLLLDLNTVITFFLFSFSFMSYCSFTPLFGSSFGIMFLGMSVVERMQYMIMLYAFTMGVISLHISIVMIGFLGIQNSTFVCLDCAL